MPKRIQRRRTAGWRMPTGATYVGRPTIWGNPWRVGTPRPGNLPPLTAKQATRLYRQWLTTTNSQPARGVDRARILNNLHQIRGRDLACWCPLPAPGEPDHCHAAVLLTIANEEQP